MSTSTGRIGGSLLAANLVRNGRDLAFDTDLLYVDVSTGRIGLRKDNPENDLQIAGTSAIADVTIDQSLVIGTVNINDSSEIFPIAGNIVFSSPVIQIQSQFLQLDQFLINDSEISSLDPAGNFDISTSESGVVYFSAETEIAQNLTVEKNLSVDSNLLIAGDLVGFGDQITDIVTFDSRIVENVKPTQTSTFNIGADGLLWKSLWASAIVVDQLRLSGNVIETKDQNATLQVLANGTGSVIADDISVKQTSVSADNIDLILIAEQFVMSDSGAVVVPRGTSQQRSRFSVGDFRLDTSDSVFEGFYVSRVGFGGVFSDDRKTSVQADPFNNEIIFKVNDVEVGKISSGLIIHRLSSQENVFVRDNIISTISTDLELRSGATGETVIDDTVGVFQSRFAISSDQSLILRNTGTGYVSFSVNTALLVPFGPTVDTSDSTVIELGDTRWNTDLARLEVFDGVEYAPAAGGGETVTAEFMQDLSDEWSLILG